MSQSELVIELTGQRTMMFTLMTLYCGNIIFGNLVIIILFELFDLYNLLLYWNYLIIIKLFFLYIDVTIYFLIYLIFF